MFSQCPNGCLFSCRALRLTSDSCSDQLCHSELTRKETAMKESCSQMCPSLDGQMICKKIVAPGSQNDMVPGPSWWCMAVRVMSLKKTDIDHYQLSKSSEAKAMFFLGYHRVTELLHSHWAVTFHGLVVSIPSWDPFVPLLLMFRIVSYIRPCYINVLLW